MGGVWLAAELVAGPGPATVLALLAAIAVTGALHEDGLADSADALGAHVDRERRLEILRDSRVGTFGALALALALLFAYAVLSELDGDQVVRAAVVAHVAARWAMVVQACVVEPARRGGAGALFRPSRGGALGATVVCAALVIGAVGPVSGAAALAAAVLLTAAAGVLVRRSLGGVTGDTLGALGKLVELGCYGLLAGLW